MKKFILVPASAIVILSSIFLLLFCNQVHAQVAGNFHLSASTDSAVYITGGTLLASGGGIGSATDDTLFTEQPIGFSFFYNGGFYTTVGISSNGFLWFGSPNPDSTLYTPISGGPSFNGAVAVFGQNITGQSSASEIRTQTSGAPGSRSFTVQWKNFVANSVFDSSHNGMNLSITLYECSGQIETSVNVDPNKWTAGNITGESGLRTGSLSDFFNASVNCSSNSWASPDTGNAANLTVSIGSCFPGDSATTTVFTYTPSNFFPLTISCMRPPVYCSNSPVIYTVNGSGGFAPYSINWSFTGDTTSSGSASNITFPDTSSATRFPTGGRINYSITVTDANGCQSTCDGEFMVVVCSSHVIDPVNIPDSILCACSSFSVNYTSFGLFNHNNTFHIQLSDSAGVFDSLYNPATFIGDLFTFADTGVIPITIPCNTPTGHGYKIRIVTDSPILFGTISADSFTVLNMDTLSVSITATDTSICSGGRVILFSQLLNNRDSATYLWQLNGNNTITNSTGSLIDSLPHNGDTIRVIVTSTGACMAHTPDTSNAIIINVNGGTAPTKPGITVSGEDTLKVTNLCSSCTLQWYSFADSSFLSTDTVFVVTGPGNYYVKATDTVNGCSNISDNVVILPTGYSVPVYSKGSMLVYPNPCNMCYLNGKFEAADLVITDLLGRTVDAVFIGMNNGYRVQFPSEQAGIYIIRNRKTGEAVKFVKN